MPRKSGNLLLWSLAFLPLVIFLTTTTAQHWQGAGQILNTLGRAAGVAGLGFMLVAAILSSRVPGFDRAFGGLTKLWKTHHLIAAFSFLLILAHPLLLAFAALAVSLDASIDLLFQGNSSLATWVGWAAMIIMTIFLAPSFAFFGEPNYQRWKFLHKFAAIAVILALVHGFLLARPVNIGWESILWSLYAALAVLAVVYRWVFSRQLLFRRHGRLKYRVVDIARPLKNVVELTLQPKQQGLVYEPGQFIYLTPYDRSLKAGYGQEHPYTISSAPHEEHLRVAIKDLGDASRALQHISLGSEVRVEGPYGAFFPGDIGEDKELWLAGGIGITPFLSRARHFLEQESEVDVHCFLCVQDEARALYREELQSIAQQLPGFTVTIHFFYREGPLTQDFVQQHCPDFTSRSCYICGPPAMLSLTQRFLRAAGTPGTRIHSEEFNLL